MKRRQWLGGIVGMAIGTGSSSPSTEENAQFFAQAQERIERHRKTQLHLDLRRKDGKPVTRAEIKGQQKRHHFLFGSNIFMWGRFPDADSEEKYRQAFAEVLNYATLPFYWAFYEPKRGQPIHDYIVRVAEWCQQNGITCKGHPLVWDHEASSPSWLPDDLEEVRRLSLQRVRDIVSRFQGLIDIWDVVNEPTDLTRFNTTMNRLAQKMGAVPFTLEALQEARRAGPKATLLVNDYRTDPAYYEILSVLKEKQAPFDVVGIQSHMHAGVWKNERIWDVCQTYQKLSLPLHFTETTILSGKRKGEGWEESTPEGEEWQAQETERFYTMLFSHPAVTAITWWDFADQGAWMDAPAGWLRKDLSPKPVYERMKELIKKRWWSSFAGVTDEQGRLTASVFKGEYQVVIKTPSGDVLTKTVTAAADKTTQITLVI
ncbi:MAG: endo-1,4-beta-xylanase [Armatimonadetes bacterium]|nr:endo-1,4-beta-xylanase [Armatimonadota bacterium]MDW8120720.1 endo-1,4-beta-xylanase [Armatimonadota bacterium]